ncbi:class I SAM-dependent methyltransferase [Microbacterium sp. NPDC056234]|uniref:class I SAM-dependent methyltransferase n=1 Tax=Microbacterium sp. NPDC056234 TaxID=3345757 RepID=UPI0035E3A358
MDHHHAHGTGHADVLDLDAHVVGHLDELTQWVGTRLRTEPSTVLDLGSGGGTGTLALARRFPRASVVALDQSPEMLAHLADAARAAGLGDRVTPVHADAEEDWPEIGAFDLVWASSSLHHMQDPARVLRAARTVLRQGGVIAAVEMDGLPRFLPTDLGFGRPGLEQRCHEAMDARGWNAHPDWGPHLQAAGFVLEDERTFTYRREPSSDARRYARQIFANVRTHLTDMLDSQDLDAIDRLLDGDAHGSLVARDDLVVRSARTVWLGRRI